MSFHDEYDNGMDSRYSLPFHRQGVPTSPMTPVQIQELAKSLNMGVKNVEVGTIAQDKFENIPTQHFDEMRRLAKLSDSKVTMHAPIVDPAGFSQQGAWSEQSRKETEQYIGTVLDRAQKLDPEGNIPIALHTTGAMLPGTRYGIDEEGKKRTEAILAIDRENGKMVDLPFKHKYELGEKEPVAWSPEMQLESLNATTWDNDKLELASKHMKLQDAMSNTVQTLSAIERAKQEGQPIEPFAKTLNLQNNQINEFERDVRLKVKSMYEDLREFGKEENKEQLEEIDKFGKSVDNLRNEQIKLELEYQDKERDQRYGEKLRRIDMERRDTYSNISNMVSRMEAPEKFVSSEEFHTEKVGETVANSAFSAYSNHGENAPIIALENVYGDNVLSRAETLKDVIVEGRSKLSDKLIKEKGMGKGEADRVAEKLIGATWDVGHINMLRKQKYWGSMSEEEFKKEVIEEAKKIAPYTKHVHISDNFGFTDAHLPPGMGTSPIKEQLKEIDKLADDAVHVMEGGAYAGQFKDNPIPYTLENMDSPLYSHNMGPNWSQVRDMYSSYMMGIGDVLPERYFSEFGVSFAKLPKELGGQLFGGDNSRFSGTPNQ